jgi:hypothetical protein
MGYSCPEEPSKPKQITTNPAAVQRIARIADAYVTVSGDDPDDFAGDLLTGLQHWRKAEGVRFGVAPLRAQMHFTAEQVEGVGR